MHGGVVGEVGAFGQIEAVTAPRHCDRAGGYPYVLPVGFARVQAYGNRRRGGFKGFNQGGGQAG